jgi:lysophospholipid acyltransferase (LPLAT)-like uncharacterized protein
MKNQIVSAGLRLLASTWRVHVDGVLPTAPCVVVFWHGGMLPVWYSFRNQDCVGLTSASNDGGMLAQLLADWGYTVVRGSSSAGGKEALHALTELATNRVVLVTPDGPRGPAGIAKPGAIVAAYRAGVPLIPVCATMAWEYVFSKSWDAFKLPLPFTRITLHIGKPILIPADADRHSINVAIAHCTYALDTLGTVSC